LCHNNTPLLDDFIIPQKRGNYNRPSRWITIKKIRKVFLPDYHLDFGIVYNRKEKEGEHGTADL
jgi:hypothetical protein